ncbi:MAG: IS66 family transposase [Candidatus Riflebacteria bacterium]|nr:IS66 family transposase [Candidatus Riflebacteria bacterium]
MKLIGPNHFGNIARTSKDKDSSPKPKNHGRHGSDEYTFSRVTEYPHELNPGDKCPNCEHGTLQRLEPRKIIRLIGQPSIVAELHQPERLRCSGCGEIITAKMPEEVGEEKATPSANAMVAVFRYGMGMPHYRLAEIQKAFGVPLPASSQYEMVEMLWTHVVPVYKELLNQAADSPLFFIDDTGTKILSLLELKDQLKEAGERTGMFTTGIVARKGNHDICLFFSGRKHAGENLTDLLNRRSANLPEPMQVSDALSRNFPKDHFTVIILCLIHARRNFIDCQEAYPDESTYVIERIGRVYANEKKIAEAKMTPQERLEYHQSFSLPVMEEIKTYAQSQLSSKKIEPNEVLGGAFQYLLKHWEGLTQFLKIPGAPLDNNESERLLKVFVRHRKNSLFYKTEDGARVGDTLMSLIQTCIVSDVNPFDYLTILQKYSKQVAKNPHLWLPWNYQSILKSVEQPKPG